MCNIGEVAKMVKMCKVCEGYEINCIGSDEQQEKCLKLNNNDIFEQQCNGCGNIFKVQYLNNGSYNYIDEPCECEDTFSPLSATPSISEWLNLKKDNGVI